MSSFQTVMTHDLEKLVRSDQRVQIIDVRETFEYEAGHIPGSINNPLSNFDLNKLKKEDHYYLVCASGSRSLQAAKALASYGYKVTNVLGGMGAYRGATTR